MNKKLFVFSFQLHAERTARHLAQEKLETEHKKILEELGNEHKVDSVFAQIRVFFYLARKRFGEHSKNGQICGIVLVIILAASLALSIFVFVDFFSVIRDLKSIDKSYKVYLSNRALLFALLLIATCYCMYHQEPPPHEEKPEVGAHVKLDIDLLVISSISVLIFNAFMIQAALANSGSSKVDGDLRSKQFFNAFLGLFQALAQVL